MATTLTTNGTDPDATVPSFGLHQYVQWAVGDPQAAVELSLRGGVTEFWEEDLRSKLRRTALQDRVASLADLPDDWDGHGGERASTEALRRASQFIERMAGSLLTVEPYPEPDGGVGLEYHSDEHFSLYISFPPSGEAAYVAVLRRGGGKEEIHRGNGIASTTQLTAIINRILEYAVTVV